MHQKRHSILLRLVAILLCFSFVIPVNISASQLSTTPRASYYLESYNSYIYPAALGKIQVWFTVTGVEYMDDIGALSIQIYESTDQINWTWVKTYTHDTTSDMLSQNKVFHSGHVDYSGTIGRYYKAYVCIWAGKDGDGDTRYIWTQPKKATLFAS